MEKQSTEQYSSATAAKTQSSSAADLPVTIIQPSRGWVPVKLKEVFEFRELLYFLVWRELKVRYKQAVLGAAWALIQPLVLILIYTIFFGWLVRVPTDGIPYPVFVATALVLWTYFATAFNQSSNSLVQYEGLITKIHFPRMLIPLAFVTAGLVDFLITFVMLLGMLAYFDYSLTMISWTMPLFLLLTVATALAVSLWLSALNVKYRDTQLLIPLLTQIWFFCTPIIYPSSLVPEPWHTLYNVLNPMAVFVEGFRWSLTGSTEPPGSILAISVLMVAVLLISGLYYFRRTERIFADVV